MRRLSDDKMTGRRASALQRMLAGPIRLGEIDVQVRRALVASGRSKLSYERGKGWSIEITDARLQALDEWNRQMAEKQRMWMAPKR